MSNAEALHAHNIESDGTPGEKVKAIIKKIKEFGRRIKEKLGLRGKELTQATDEALVFNAKETISTADEDGVRSEEEQLDIEEAVSSVVVEGAMEEAGIIEAADENPIVFLDEEETAADLAATLRSFNDSGETLPNGQKIADLASEVLRRKETTEMGVPELSSIEASDGRAESRERTPRVEFVEAIDSLRSQEYVRSGETLYRPRAEIICDRDHIEDQRVDIIGHNDRGTTEVTFKLRSMPKFEGDKTPSGARIFPGQIDFESVSHDNEQKLCKAIVFVRNNVRVSVASDEAIHSSLGLVRMEAPVDMPPDEVERIVSEILSDDFGVPDALDEVPGESEREYKDARYRWHHKIEGELSAEQQEAAEGLSRKEVFPGYTTMVEEGKHREYLEKYGDDIRPVHRLGTGGASSIYRILTVGGMCSTERYRRGALRPGMSTTADFQTGGADSFYTRLKTKKEAEGDMSGALNGAVVMYKPSLLDRTDWYAYDCDQFGTTEENAFRQRLTPDEMLEKVGRGNASYRNEQMFRIGIGPQYVESIIVPERCRLPLIEELKEMGLTEFDGRPIEEVIISPKPPDYDSSQPEDISVPHHDPFSDTSSPHYDSYYNW